jgi:hypothetical protein
MGRRSDGDFQSVVRRLDAGRQLGGERRVGALVREVREIRSRCANLKHHLERLAHAQVRRMRLVEQGIHDQHARTAQLSHCLRGHALGVRHVRERADAVRKYRDRAMRHRDRRHVHAGDAHRASGLELDRARLGLGRAGERADRVVEDVVELPREAGERVVRAVDRQMLALQHRERPQVIDAVRMIRMAMRVEYGIHAGDARPQQLHAQLGRGVDQDDLPAIGLDRGADSRALVTGVGRPAHLTAASELGHPEARPRAEEGQLHAAGAALPTAVIRSRPS